MSANEFLLNSWCFLSAPQSGFCFFSGDAASDCERPAFSLPKHHMFARSSITFNIDDGVSDASPPSPPVSTQMSGRSMKSMTLDDEATSSTMVHYVPWPSGRFIWVLPKLDIRTLVFFDA